MSIPPVSPTEAPCFDKPVFKTAQLRIRQDQDVVVTLSPEGVENAELTHSELVSFVAAMFVEARMQFFMTPERFNKLRPGLKEVAKHFITKGKGLV